MEQSIATISVVSQRIQTMSDQPLPLQSRAAIMYEGTTIRSSHAGWKCFERLWGWCSMTAAVLDSTRARLFLRHFAR